MASTDSNHKHILLAVSASGRGPALYAFCKDRTCRWRIFKAKTIIVARTGIDSPSIQAEENCVHELVQLTRSPHLFVSGTCRRCHTTLLRRKGVDVKTELLKSPKIDMFKKAGGESRLSTNDPRLQ